MFVAIEGIDASGKNTQAKLLAERISAKLYSFPDYDTISGRVIEAHLKSGWKAMKNIEASDLEGGQRVRTVSEWQPDDKLDAFVFQAVQIMNRLEHAADMYERLYKRGEHVVADRYTASAMVYGGMDGLDQGYLVDIHRYLPQPDFWVLVDIDVETSIQRRPQRRDRYESDKEYMERVADSYRQLWTRMRATEGDKWVALDGRRSIGDVHTEILRLCGLTS